MNKNGKLLLTPSLLWLVVFFVIPMLIVIAVSLSGRTPYGEIIFRWSLGNYARFFDALYISIFAQTLFVAAVTTVCTILMGYPLAYYIAGMPPQIRQKGLILCMIPFWINFIIRSYAWVIILRTQGVINTILLKLGIVDLPVQFLYNEGAVMVGMVYALLPFMILPVYVADLGASPFRAFRKITLPLTMPGIAAGTILVFISSLGMFVIPDVMGGSKAALVGNVIQNQFLSARDWPFGSALSILLALLSLVLIFLYYKAINVRKGGNGHAKNLA